MGVLENAANLENEEPDMDFSFNDHPTYVSGGFKNKNQYGF